MVGLRIADSSALPPSCSLGSYGFSISKMNTTDDSITSCEQDGGFPLTSWSLIRSSQDSADPVALAALDRLARAYWRPLYAWARSAGLGHEQAEDEVQELFERIVSRETLRTLVAGERRFRWFLLACLKNAMVSSQRASLRQKRGGGAAVVSLDEAEQVESPDAETPEAALDKAWAREVFNRAMSRLGEDAEQRGRGEIFAVLKSVLAGEMPEGGYAALAVTLAATDGAVRKMVFDFRARLGVLIRQEVELTVADPAEVDDELRHLVALL